MKKKLLTIIVFIVGLVSIANAQIPNPGFENWYTSASGLDPVGWITSNATPFVSVVQATGYQGTYAVKVKTWQAGPMTVAGICQSNGFHFSSRPGSLSGFMKCTIMPGDSATIFLTATLGGLNGTGVGAGIKYYTASVSSFTAFNIPIYYASGSATDSIYISILAGRQNSPISGTEIVLDELSLSPSTGIDNTEVPASDRVGQNYPNPARGTTVIPLNLASPGHINVQIFDMSGRVVKTIFDESMPEGVQHINFSVADLRDGIYYYTVHGNNFTGSKKFTVSK